MKVIKENWKPFLSTCFLFTVGIEAGLEYYARTNLTKHKEKLENEKLVKDTTRPQNEYFGINWGYAADVMVKDKFDSGDLVFMKFECWNFFSGSQIRSCIWDRFKNPYPHYDSIGLIYRDYDQMKILYASGGKLIIDDYADLLQMAWLQELSGRKLLVKDIDKNKQIYKASKNLIASKDNSNMDQSKFIHKILSTGLDCLQKEWADKIVEKKVELVPEDLDSGQPKMFKQECSLGSKICIRNRTNLELES